MKDKNQLIQVCVFVVVVMILTLMTYDDITTRNIQSQSVIRNLSIDETFRGDLFLVVEYDNEEKFVEYFTSAEAFEIFIDSFGTDIDFRWIELRDKLTEEFRELQERENERNIHIIHRRRINGIPAQILV